MIGTPPHDANKYVRVFAMIETAEAIKNLDEILDVEGLDGVFVGIVKNIIEMVVLCWL